MTDRSIVDELKTAYSELRRDMRARWKRDLPFSELVFDRWERAASLGFGTGASIYHDSYVYGDVTVGEGTWIGPQTLLDGSGGLTIGHHCSISAGVQIYSHDTVVWALSGGKADPERAAVRIGDCCHIGAGTIVLKGVTIGEHTVIGAGAVVTRDIPPYTIAVGVPCRPVGRVELGEDGVVSLHQAD